MVEKNAKLYREVFKHEAMVVGLLQVPYLLLNKNKEGSLNNKWTAKVIFVYTPPYPIHDSIRTLRFVICRTPNYWALFTVYYR